MEEGLRKVKTLGSTDPDANDISSWVTKSREVAAETKRAAERAAAAKLSSMYDEEVRYRRKPSVVPWLVYAFPSPSSIASYAPYGPHGPVQTSCPVLWSGQPNLKLRLSVVIVCPQYAAGNVVPINEGVAILGLRAICPALRLCSHLVVAKSWV